MLAVLLAAGAAAPPALTWTTLGTDSGPFIKTDRSQPANLLVAGPKTFLVECGSGAMQRLASAGLQPVQVDGVFLSHVHMDHVAGLEGLIGLRWMAGARAPLTIYGPPGTDQLIAGLLASMQPASLIVNSASDVQNPPPASTVKVVIVRDGQDFTVGDLRVRAVSNTHFDRPLGHSLNPSTQSLSYRFDRAGYAIAYTGDTGPSAHVTRLVTGADLLVSEVIDLPSILADAAAHQPNMPAAARAMLTTHLLTQHLTPQEAGRMAAAAGVGRLVFTHFAAAGAIASAAHRLRAGAAAVFGGRIEIARDLDKF